jgi:hypothetical protein
MPQLCAYWRRVQDLLHPKPTISIPMKGKGVVIKISTGDFSKYGRASSFQPNELVPSKWSYRDSQDCHKLAPKTCDCLSNFCSCSPICDNKSNCYNWHPATCSCQSDCYNTEPCKGLYMKQKNVCLQISMKFNTIAKSVKRLIRH